MRDLVIGMLRLCIQNTGVQCTRHLPTVQQIKKGQSSELARVVAMGVKCYQLHFTAKMDENNNDFTYSADI